MVDLVFVSRGELGEVVLELRVYLLQALGLLRCHLLAAFSLLLFLLLLSEECGLTRIHLHYRMTRISQQSTKYEDKEFA